MRFIDLINAMKDDDFITVYVDLHGVGFHSSHSASYWLKVEGYDFCYMRVSNIWVADDTLNVKLKPVPETE